MFRAIIKRENKITNQNENNSREDLVSWLEREIANGSFGKPEREEIIFDETGKELEVIKHPTEFTYEIVDITAEIEAKKQAQEAKKLAKKQRLENLKSINYTSINSVAELKAVVKWLVEKQLEEAE